MAPPRRIVRSQLDMLINFLEENQDAIHGGPQGGTSIAVTRKKWMVLAKKLNSVEGGTMKTPEAWKKVPILCVLLMLCHHLKGDPMPNSVICKD